MNQLFTNGINHDRKRDKELIEELYKQVGKLQTQLDWLKKRWDISSKDKIALIEPDNPALSIREQYNLLDLTRSVYYYEVKPEVSAEDIVVMDAIDQLYTKRPYFVASEGSPNIWIFRALWSITSGYTDSCRSWRFRLCIPSQK